MIQAFDENKLETLKEESLRWNTLKNEIKKIVVGQDAVIDKLCMGILCNGHILLEGLPGLAKTTLIKALSETLGFAFQRIQFTPDLLPADIIGTLIYNPKTQEFHVKKGPLFANLILADEINRAPAKVQSALLEAMQEKQVTIGDQTLMLPLPFLVLATQNPIEQEGTYRLPEAQVDRFMFKVLLTHPSFDDEKEIISKVFNPVALHQVLTKEDVIISQNLVRSIYVDERIVDYIVSIIYATRNPHHFNLASLAPLIQHGVSPRGTLMLHHAARAHAFLRKRNFVIPEDIKAVAYDVLRHRIAITYEAEAENITTETVLNKILEKIPVP